MIYKIKEPYPKVKVINKHEEDVALLLELLAGIDSKISCIQLYTYNYCIFNEELKEAYFFIKAIKTNHLELLMDCIYQYGIEPRLWTLHYDTVDYWSPFYCNYNTDSLLAIKNSVLLEIQVIEKIQHCINTIQDPNVRVLLKRIYQEDLLHLDIFSDIYERLVSISLAK